MVAFMLVGLHDICMDSPAATHAHELFVFHAAHTRESSAGVPLEAVR